MALETAATSSSRSSIVGAAWFHLIVRLILALLALWTLVFARDRYLAWGLDRVVHFRSDTWLWLSWLGLNVAAGILFGLATSLPFARVRYAWDRLVLALIPLLPIAQFWWRVVQWERPGPVPSGWLWRADWFQSPELLFVLAALAGVAIASGFRAKGPTSAAA
jgi:hypothetical protein